MRCQHEHEYEEVQNHAIKERKYQFQQELAMTKGMKEHFDSGATNCQLIAFM
mgnify:CR=1 FL=1